MSGTPLYSARHVESLQDLLRRSGDQLVAYRRRGDRLAGVLQAACRRLDDAGAPVAARALREIAEEIDRETEAEVGVPSGDLSNRGGGMPAPGPAVAGMGGAPGGRGPWPPEAVEIPRTGGEVGAARSQVIDVAGSEAVR